MAQNQISDTFAYPVAPDTSRAAYDWYLYNQGGQVGMSPDQAGLANTLDWWFSGSKNRSYESWKLQQENEYNAALANYQSSLETPAAKRAMQEAAGYNMNYSNDAASFQGAASPGTYTAPMGTPGLQGLEGIGQIIGFLTQLQTLETGEIENKTKLQELDFAKQLFPIQKSGEYSKVTNLDLENNLKNLLVAKTMASLFNPEDIPIITNQFASGMTNWGYDSYMDSLVRALKEGPFVQSLGKSLDISDEQIRKLMAEAGIKEQEEGLYSLGKGVSMIAPFLRLMMMVLLKR